MAIKFFKFKEMKKLLIYISIAMLIASCESREIEFPDYAYQTVYFPVQYPVRNLVLGESRFDNSIDLENAFTIGVNVAGMYKNTKERVVYVRYAPELVNVSTITSLGDTIKVLPLSYYTPDPLTIDKIVIPAGSFDGRIRINLTNEFFMDPKSVGVKYVIPFVILPTTQDSVLTGLTVDGVTNPNRLKTADWQAGYLPMDFTLYGIKYTNKFHGNYFHYGVDNIYKADVLFSTKKYSTPFVENNTITMVKTVSLTESTIDRLGGTNIGAKYTIKLKFNEDKTISLSSVPSPGSVVVTGSGVLKDAKDGVVWGGKGHKTLILDYIFTDAVGEHRCNDTLVYRTNSIIYQEFILRQ